MGTLFDYLKWRGDISFTQLGINQVDNLIFSELSYLNFKDIAGYDYNKRISLKEASDCYFAMQPVKKIPRGILPADEIKELLMCCAETERFKNVELWGYRNEVSKKNESQFAALSFTLPGNCSYIAFRGTDNTVAGWKENFNMSFMFPVPAQEKAAEYLRYAANSCDGPLHVGGHSKGGNLAEYASALAPDDIKKRIEHIWSNDGPGFMAEFLKNPEYQKIRGKITKIMPESSVVGVLLDSDCETIIIESSNFGPKQHEGVSWLCEGGSFIQAEDTSSGSKRVDETIDVVLNSFSPEERKEFLESVFDAVYKTGVTSLQELFSLGRKPQYLLSSIDMEPELKEKFIRALMVSGHIDERIIHFIFDRSKSDKK